MAQKRVEESNISLTYLMTLMGYTKVILTWIVTIMIGGCLQDFDEMKYRGHGGTTGWSGVGNFYNFRPIVAESPSALTEKFEDIEKYVISADPYRSTRKSWCMRKPPAAGFKR